MFVYVYTHRRQMCIHLVAYRTSTTTDFNVLSDNAVRNTFLHMIVVALSCVCDYGMAQDPSFTSLVMVYSYL